MNDPVLEDFQTKIHFTDGRYQVSLPWKDYPQFLPDNYQLCQVRLKGLLKRLQQDKEILREYDSIIESQLSQGIVEHVENSSVETTNKIHYLPHHAVVRRDKETTKVREVYDASARSAGPSLNDCLHTGPRFDQHIFDLLLRFRTHPIAITADIEKAFLRLGSQYDAKACVALQSRATRHKVLRTPVHNLRANVRTTHAISLGVITGNHHAHYKIMAPSRRSVRNNKLRLLLVISLYLRRRRKRRRLRRDVWVRDIFSRRQQQGEFHQLVQEMRLHDRESHFRYFRMSRERFDHLLSLVFSNAILYVC